MAQTVKIKLVKSPIGYSKDQRATLEALGLRKLGKVVEKDNNSSIRGMIRKVQHLVLLEEA